MKKLLFFALAALLFNACAPKQPTIPANAKHTAFAYNATIYELNVRQLTPQGTFAAAEAELPKLKDMGVDIIWVMPLQPIGKITRKGTLGSYYSISDYCAFNPEFGTRADFEHLLAKAHELGMKVILDWVANHTAPDSEWTKNEGWHYRDSLGNLMIQYDWTDIAKLNYNNPDMRDAMKQAMHFWMDSIGIDGFRCDVAGEVPTDFWNDIMAELREAHPDMFTLAEDEDKRMQLCRSAFDMYYGWRQYLIFVDIAKGEKTAEDLWAYQAHADSTVQPYAIRMNFITNHDENSWAGSNLELYGSQQAIQCFTALTYILPGMPMIYTGSEYDNNHRLQFFEKDLIDRNEQSAMRNLYTTLNQLREQHWALWSPELGATIRPLNADNPNIFACARQAEGDAILGIFNLSNTQQKVIIDDELWDQDLTIDPWGYQIIVK